MKVALIEPYLTGSHKQWATEIQQFSSHEVKLFGLSGRNWKWRMQGGAIELANQLLTSDFKPDLFLFTDMLNVPLFLSLVRHKYGNIKTVIYFHENQLAYPWSAKDGYFDRDRISYGFINYISAISSDKILFNSKYNRDSFLEGVTGMLKKLPDYNGLNNITKIREKSEVLPVGMDFTILDKFKEKKDLGPVILWNHRFEYDKNPEDFFQVLFQLQAEEIPYKLIVLGKEGRDCPKIFKEAKKRLVDRIIHFGYVESKEEYAKLLWRSNIQPITSNQDFFGISAVEGLYCGCYPIFPNRLAFPEHFKDRKYLYNSNDELIMNLKDVINNKRYIDFSLEKVVEKYSWSKLIKAYDSVLGGESK